MKKFSYILLVCVVGLLVYNIVGWPFLIRFQDASLNYWFYSLLLLGVPISLLLIAINTRKTFAKSLTIIFLLISIIPFGAMSIMSVYDALEVRQDGTDPGFEKIDEINIDTGTYRLYVGNCGATCSFNMVMNKEIDLPGGIKLVFQKWSMEHEYQAKFVLTDSTIQVVSTILDESILTELPK